MRPPPSYTRVAFLHPCHLILLIFFALGALIQGHWAPLVAVGGLEVIYLLLVPELGWFRSWVDAVEAEEQNAARRDASERRLAPLSREHRQRAEALEELLRKIRDNIDQQGEAVRTVLEDSFDQAQRLVGAYIRLAKTQTQYHRYLNEMPQKSLETEIASLIEGASKPGLSEGRKILLEQRLAIARRRLEQRERTVEATETAIQQMETISAMVSLMYEQSIAPRNTDRFRDDMGTFLRDLEKAQTDAGDLAAYNEEVEEVLTSYNSQQRSS